MKLKLVAIAMIALLVLTVVPMAATAAPTPKTTITKNVKFWNTETMRAYGKAGTIALDLDADTVSFVSEGKLKASTPYGVTAVATAGKEWISSEWFFTEPTDSDGHFHLTGASALTLDPGEETWWNTYGTHAFFYIEENPQ